METNRLVLIGPPNSGKTTLFNWLTGYRARVVNYPGSTVDYCKGTLLKKYDFSCQVIDTPGIYSIFAKNPSEKITGKILFESKKAVIVVTIDAFRLFRQLPLVMQLKESGFKVIIALTMMDLIAKDKQDDIANISKKLKIPVYPIEGKLGKGVMDLVQGVKQAFQSVGSKPIRTPGVWLSNLQDYFFKKTDDISSAFHPQNSTQVVDSKAIDRFLLHPIFGVFSFVMIMFLLFSSIFWAAAPLMDMVDVSFSFLSEKIQSLGESLWVDFVSNGIITSFGAVFVFVPQIFILFVGICILEDSGYLARSASLMDALFSKLGLSGRAFVPFLSGYACAIPACLSARNISSRIERLIVIAVIPILTCSARLPVYSLLLSLFFYGEPVWKAGVWMTIIYLSSMVLALLSAGLLHRLARVKENTPFVMELPMYRCPMVLGVISYAWRRTYSYIKGAGPLIFLFALIVWVATHFPRNLELNEAEQIEQSYAGQFGQVIEPAVEWMGGDWRVGVSLLSAFVAREVFVSTLATLFQITQTQSEETLQHSLLKKMNKAKK